MSAPHTLTAPAAAHVPLSFLHGNLKHDEGAQFVALAMDIAQGIKVCLEMANNSILTHNMNINADACEKNLPLLDVTDTERIMRFASAAAQLLASHAEKRIALLNEYGVKEE